MIELFTGIFIGVAIGYWLGKPNYAEKAKLLESAWIIQELRRREKKP